MTVKQLNKITPANIARVVGFLELIFKSTVECVSL